ncbi:hypothetical protein GCM10007382_09160 [Salinibacterium xinjiangense]|uniref:Uncharacterized protein, contains FMN-binding domain n=1 Tax=Salinibacterium xinjiangense TaxID=386302 RepID=A0A2C8Z996_9MICO|nr:hypothetical protein [Salinibacterium xinjiangense]GGK91225.1 hypothetical protein GCM10007382_09160 [Salinibacterium xinjiangense]SOE60579.1 Uncharacterized protein, contains FMN-binding domain [Salinibacterium xinjiangense]
MRSLHDHKPAIAVFAGLTLVGALAGCSSATAGGDANSKSDAAVPSGATYADGTYTESGSYQSPNGTETVDVTITLGNGIVTDVTVVGKGESRDSQRYQGEFINGIAAEVVGKNIDTLKVSKVAGSSLTSGGFNSAVDTIKADAAS